jgi:hypothetical protein
MKVITIGAGNLVVSISLREFSDITGKGLTDKYGNYFHQDLAKLEGASFDLSTIRKAHQNVQNLLLLKNNVKKRFDEIYLDMEKAVFPLEPITFENENQKGN